MEIKGYCRRKLSPAESAAVSGFAQAALREMNPKSAVVLLQNGEDLEAAYIENDQMRLRICSADTLPGIGTGGAVHAAASKIMDDFKQKEGIDLRTNGQAKERVEHAVAEAFEKLTASYTAEIFLPFIADVAHLEANISRMDADALMADASAKVKSGIKALIPEQAEPVFIVKASEAEAVRLGRILKDIYGAGEAAQIILDDGTGQEKEDAWIVRVLDQENAAEYPAFADHVLPSAEALILGRFGKVLREMRRAAAEAPGAESGTSAFVHGMEMTANRLEKTLTDHHALDTDEAADRAAAAVDLTEIPLGDMKSLTKEILGTMDDLERGLASVSVEMSEQDPSLAQSRESFDRIHTASLKCLESLRITPIASEGRAFDPRFHDAAMHVEDKKLGENTVAQELQKGYMFGNAVLRYAVVKVAN